MLHSDLTRCAGPTCAWTNDGGHSHAGTLAEVLLDNILVDDEFLGALQDCVIAADNDSNDDEIEALHNALAMLTARLDVTWPNRGEIDDESSASRQFKINTGRYMTHAEAWEVTPDVSVSNA